jgi:hypothetical protein
VNWKKLTSFFIGFVIGVLIGFFTMPTKTLPPPDPEIQIFYKTRDSIITIIDTIKDTKYKIKVIYEKEADSIWNQSPDDDWKYFINYLRTRFPSNSDSTEANKHYLQ